MNRFQRSESKQRNFQHQAYQYHAVDSPVHQLNAGWKLALCIMLGMTAALTRSPWIMGGLLTINFCCYFLARLSISQLWTDSRFFIYQMVIVVGLYILKYGIAEGLIPGIQTCLKILLLFMPGMILIRTTQGTAMMKGLSRIMSPNLAFTIFTSLRFIPFFTREFREIAIAQRLRGARIAPRQLLNPANWADVVHCLLVPLIIRAMKTAGEAALSAESRGIHLSDKPGRNSC